MNFSRVSSNVLLAFYKLHKRRKQAFTCLPGQPEENLLFLPSTHLEKKTQTFGRKHSSSKDTEFREFIENESSDIDLERHQGSTFLFSPGPITHILRLKKVFITFSRTDNHRTSIVEHKRDDRQKFKSINPG